MKRLRFTKKIRDAIVNSLNKESVFLFVNLQGNKMTTDLFNKSVKSIWNLAGLKWKMSATILWKTITSNIHDNYGNTEKAMTARLLSHRESTAAQN